MVVSQQIPYKEDWEAEKQQVYYPVHITPEYEASSDVKKVQSDVSDLTEFQIGKNKFSWYFHLQFGLVQASYKGDYEQSKDKNLYKVTDTDQYKSIAEGQKALSDVSRISPV